MYLRSKQLKELFHNTGINVKHTLRDVEITGVRYDSRRVEPGDLFVAIRGFQTDGHRYLKKAQQAGAIAALVEEPDHGLSYPQIVVHNTRQALAKISYNFYLPDIADIRLTGITGTNGKTTSAYLMRSVYLQAGLPTGLIGTIAYYTGAEQQTPATITTPESVDISELLFKMHQQQQQCCIMEVSSHALELYRVDALSFETAVFTNLSRDHLDFHESEEHYFRAKARLFNQIQSGGTAVINIDDSHGARLLKQLKHKCLPFGTGDNAAIKPREWKSDIHGIDLVLDTPRGQLELKSPLICSFNIYNIMAAVGAGIAADLSEEAIINGVGAMHNVPGRMEKLEIAPQILAVVDYAHTPDALEKVLRALREITQGRLIVVFGAGGDRDKGKRPLMGRIAETHADLALVTTDNPRYESPDAIIKDIVAGMKRKERYKVISDRKEAIAEAVRIAQPGDVILAAGKGHESYQEVQGKKNTFDEWAIIKEAVKHGHHS